MRRFLASLYPLSIGLSLVWSGAPVALVRGLSVASAGAGFGRTISGRHRLWGLALLAWVLANALSVPFAIDRDVAMADLIRQSILATSAFFLSVALVDARTRHAFMATTLVIAAVGTGLILFAYLSHASGDSITLASLVQIKYAALIDDGLSLNPLSFAVVLCFLIGWPVLSRPGRLLGLLLVAGAVLLSGSKTTIIAVGVTTAAGVVIAGARRAGLSWSALAYVGALAGVVAAVGAVVFLGWDGSVDPAALSGSTTGRADLWVAAWARFLERPLTGWGGGCWTTGLDQFLPSWNASGVDLLDLSSGGAHNALLTVLAEKGLIASSAAIGLVVLLTRSAFVARAGDLKGPARLLGQTLPLAMTIVIVRSLGEQPGFIGYANSSVDYLEFALGALIVALATLADAAAQAPVARPASAKAFTSASPAGSLP